MHLRRTPKYRHYKPKNLGMVVIDGRAHYLGGYDSPESRERYHRLVAELHAGRPAARPPTTSPAAEAGPTVGELILAYAGFVDGYYVKDGRPTVEPTNIRLALRVVRRLYGSTPACSFGPLALKAVREEMIRAGNCRSEINRRVGRVVRMFKWGVAEELIEPVTLEALRAVAGLRKGRSTVREKPPVNPVADVDVDALCPHLGRRVWAMIQLQRLTGMRPGEVVIMRTGDIDQGGETWVYTPARHKSEHHGKPREVLIGPRGQEILRPWLKADPGAYLFSPAEATLERREAMRGRRQTGVQPSQADRSKSRPKKVPGACYTVASYRRAIQAACLKGGWPGGTPTS